MNKLGYGGKPCPFKTELTGVRNKQTYIGRKEAEQKQVVPRGFVN